MQTNKKQGFIYVFTGNGKGKTTSAIGLCVRARAHGLKVCYLSFHKQPDRWGYGEVRILKKLGIKVKTFACGCPLFDPHVPAAEVRRECLKALVAIQHLFQKDMYDLIVLDEILVSVQCGFLKEKELIDLMLHKPPHLELVLTGRGATKRIIHHATLVSQIKEVKHPFQDGHKAKKGIEY